MDKGRPESVGFDEIIIISQHITVLLLFFHSYSPFQIYFVKQVNEYKNKSINACHDRRRFKNKIVRDNTLAVSPICSSLIMKQLHLARNAIRDGFSVYSIRVSYGPLSLVGVSSRHDRETQDKHYYKR